MEVAWLRTTRSVLAAAHLDSDPTNNRMKNLRALCQRCHILHDRPHHLAQRWITYRRRLAVGDLFLGPYPALIVELALARASNRTGGGLSVPSSPVARAPKAEFEIRLRADALAYLDRQSRSLVILRGEILRLV
jgi:hypothetical protein